MCGGKSLGSVSEADLPSSPTCTGHNCLQPQPILEDEIFVLLCFVWYLLIFVSYFFNVCLIIWQRNWLLFYVVRIVWLFYGGKLPGKIFVYVRTFGEYKTEIYVGKSFSLLDTELLRNGIYLFSYTNIFKVLYTSTRVTQQRNCTVVCFIINFFKNKSSKQYAPLQGAWEPYPKPFRSSSSLEGPSTWKTFAS